MMCTGTVFWRLAVISAMMSVVIADEGDTITPITRWKTAFADSEVELMVRVKNARSAGTLLWSYSASERTLRRGEIAVRPDGTASLTLRTPKLREGVLLQTQLKYQFSPANGQAITAEVVRPLWLFPRDILKGRTVWAESLDVEVFDPSGETMAVFDSLRLPYRKIRTLAGAQDGTGLLVIGEGLSFRQTDFVQLMKAMNSGRRVIVLAPRDAAWTLFDTNATLPAEIRFAGNQVISELDKRLDAESWMSAGSQLPARRVNVESRRSRTQVSVTDDANGWPWVEVKSGTNDGHILLCGFRIVKHIENGPTPRFLLLRILEQGYASTL